MSLKVQALNAIEKLPSDVNYGDILREISLLAALKEAEQQSLEGKTIPHSEVKRDLESWVGR